MQSTLGISDHDDSWNSVCEKIVQTEKAYRKRKEGFWHSLWYKAGDSRDILEGWTSLIPNQYGLAIVKASIAVIFKVNV